MIVQVIQSICQSQSSAHGQNLARDIQMSRCPTGKCPLQNHPFLNLLRCPRQGTAPQNKMLFK